MRPIVKDRVAWSVCLSVCNEHESCKMAEHGRNHAFYNSKEWAETTESDSFIVMTPIT